MSELKVEIVESKVNKLIGRRELILKVSHWPSGTPSRAQLRGHVAEILRADPEAVYVRKLRTSYGMCESLARVHVYDSAQRALQIEPDYVVRRNREAKGERGGEGNG